MNQNIYDPPVLQRAQEASQVWDFYWINEVYFHAKFIQEVRAWLWSLCEAAQPCARSSRDSNHCLHANAIAAVTSMGNPAAHRRDSCASEYQLDIGMPTVPRRARSAGQGCSGGLGHTSWVWACWILLHRI